MSKLQPFLDQANAYLTSFSAGGLDYRMLLSALLALVGGVLLCVMGAKLARVGVTVALALGGLAFGAEYGARLGMPAPLGAALAGGMLATIGFLTFRLWAGVLTGLVACTLALSVFGYRNVAPHAADFQPLGMSVAAQDTLAVSASHGSSSATGEFLPTPPREWLRQFWDFVRSRNATITSDAEPIVAAALLIGLFLGVLAVRGMLILSTSLVGTSLVFGGAVTLLSQIAPSSLAALEGSPGAMGMAAGGFLVSSLILQALLTRKNREPDSERTK